MDKFFGKITKFIGYLFGFVIISYLIGLSFRYFEIKEAISSSKSIVKNFQPPNELNLLSFDISSDSYFPKFTDIILYNDFYRNIKFNYHYQYQFKENVDKYVYLSSFLIEMCLNTHHTIHKQSEFKFINTFFDKEMNKIGSYDMSNCTSIVKEFLPIYKDVNKIKYVFFDDFQNFKMGYVMDDIESFDVTLFSAEEKNNWDKEKKIWDNEIRNMFKPILCAGVNSFNVEMIYLAKNLDILTSVVINDLDCDTVKNGMNDFFVYSKEEIEYMGLVAPSWYKDPIESLLE